MMVVEKYGSYEARRSGGYGLGLVRSTSFWRRRIALSNNDVVDFGNQDDCTAITPLKRFCFTDKFSCGGKSALEELPQEILIRILCGVEHDDLKRLFFVSKTMRQATLIAKQSYFAYSTPRKTIPFHKVDIMDDDYNDIQVPNAPKQSRLRRKNRLGTKNLADITISLFSADDNKELRCEL